jgi:hypothetical protein
VEDAVSTGADEAGGDKQDDPEQDLALEELHDSDDGDDRSDDEQQHEWTLLVNEAMTTIAAW